MIPCSPGNHQSKVCCSSESEIRSAPVIASGKSSPKANQCGGSNRQARCAIPRQIGSSQKDCEIAATKPLNKKKSVEESPANKYARNQVGTCASEVTCPKASARLAMSRSKSSAGARTTNDCAWEYPCRPSDTSRQTPTPHHLQAVPRARDKTPARAWRSPQSAASCSCAARQSLPR